MSEFTAAEKEDIYYYCHSAIDSSLSPGEESEAINRTRFRLLKEKVEVIQLNPVLLNLTRVLLNGCRSAMAEASKIDYSRPPTPEVLSLIKLFNFRIAVFNAFMLTSIDRNS